MKKSLISRLNHIFPPLKAKSIKGENGRIGVVGGSYEFTGAPFYAAISALKTGSDLAHIFCSNTASPSIKSYSPEIIVHPVFRSSEEVIYSNAEKKQAIQEWLQKIKSWEKAIHAWVIGPGLGRDPYMNEFFPLFIKSIAKNKIVVFDADGIYHLSQYPELFETIKDLRTIITPNKREMLLLQPYLNHSITEAIHYDSTAEEIQQLPELYNKSHEFSLLMKGESDFILGPQSYVVKTEGGRKRCGGVGDVLAGVTAACSFWHYELGPVLASRIVRVATRRAYEKEGRSLTAPSVVRELSSAVRDIEQGRI